MKTRSICSRLSFHLILTIGILTVSSESFAVSPLPPVCLTEGYYNYYATLQAAMNEAPDGSSILSRNVSLAENISLDRGINITLSGGYDDSYSAASGYTTLLGSLTLLNGTTVIDTFIIASNSGTSTQITVTPVSGAGGELTPGDHQTLPPGSTTAFRIIPDSGNQIATITGCGGARFDNIYTTSPLTADCTVEATFVPVVYQMYGIGFSPYMDGQDPNLRSQISEEQLRSRMAIIAPYTQWIRTFGSGDGLEKAGAVARELNLKAAMGAWLSDDLAENEIQITNLINSGMAHQLDIAIVGSEVLLRNELDDDKLIEYINRVRQSLPGVPVTTADVYSELLNHPRVVAACDIVFVNYYPYWEGIRIDQAVSAVHSWHQQVTHAAGGKQVVVSETGWPSGGNTVGNALPSPENAAFYFLNFVSWARANNVQYFYFEAFDEGWKVAYEGPQGAHWGVWDKDGVMKQGMMDVFNGNTMPNNWDVMVCGPGTPEITFTTVPPTGVLKT